MILLRGWLARTLVTQSASKLEKLIAQQEICLSRTIGRDFFRALHRQNFQPRGPFLESPGNFLGAKSNIQIEI